jgi:hypothetical protein
MTQITISNRHGVFRLASLLSIALVAGCAHQSAREQRARIADDEKSRLCGEDAGRAAEELLASVQGVAPLFGPGVSGKHARPGPLTGAELWFAADRGISRQWLERTLRCHEAALVLDPERAIAGPDPLWSEDGWVDVEVRSNATSFVVLARGATQEENERVLARALALVADRSGR